MLVDLIESRFSLNTEKRCFISSSFWYIFPYLFITKKNYISVCLSKIRTKTQRCMNLCHTEERTYSWVKRAKERTWRDWPKIWRKDSSTSRRLSETIRVLGDSSDSISTADDAVMRITRTTDDMNALTDMSSLVLSFLLF